MKLMSDDELERSAVVANCRMNRERNLLGSNGYNRELGLNPLDFLKERITTTHPVTWLDLCCGTGKALAQAARQIHSEGLTSQIEIVGVDLVGMFDQTNSSLLPAAAGGFPEHLESRSTLRPRYLRPRSTLHRGQARADLPRRILAGQQRPLRGEPRSCESEDFRWSGCGSAAQFRAATGFAGL